MPQIARSPEISGRDPQSSYSFVGVVVENAHESCMREIISSAEQTEYTIYNE